MSVFPTKTLSSVCDISMGQAPKGDSYNATSSGYPLIAGAGDLGELTPAPKQYTDAPTKLSRPGDLILCIRATIGDRNWSDKEYCLGRGVAGLRAKAAALSQAYLGHWLDHAAPVLRSSGRGATFLQVSKGDIASLEIPLPPLAEQKRIAAILDAADALRAKRREALAQLDTLLQSTFLDMFGDPVTNPMGWEEEHLPNLVSKRKHSLKRGPFGGALKKEIFVPEGFKVYEQRNVIYNDFNAGSYFVKKSDYERLIAFNVLPNDLLISCSGTIGRVAAVSADAAPGIMNQALLKITLDESRMLNTFFLGLWRSQPFEQQVLGMTHGTGMKNMKSMNELKSIKFPAPPLGFQRRFAAIVQSVEQQKTSQRDPPGRTRHPLRLPAIPRLPGRPLSRYGNLRQLRVPEAGVPACGRERELCGAPRLRRPAGLLLPCEACAGASRQTCLQGREDPGPTEGHEPGRLPQRARLPCARARGGVAEGGVHPAGGQPGGARQPAARARAGVERGAGAGARPLLGGSHLSAERERRAFTGRPSTSRWSPHGNRARRRPASRNWMP